MYLHGRQILSSAFGLNRTHNLIAHGRQGLIFGVGVLQLDYQIGMDFARHAATS